MSYAVMLKHCYVHQNYRGKSTLAPILNLVAAMGYIALAFGVTTFEKYRTKRLGVDEFTVVTFFILLYLLIPGAAIHIIFALSDSDLTLGNSFFDRVYGNFSLLVAFLVLASTALFVFGFITSSGVVLKKESKYNYAPKKIITVRKHTSVIIIFLMFGIVLYFFWSLGGSIAERYARLILFRAQDESVVRDAFSANAFSLTQTVAWLSSAFSVWALRSKKFVLFVIFFGLAIISGAIMGSRRGVMFPMILMYFCYSIYRKSWHMWKILPIVPFAVLWIAFGKELIGSTAYGTETQQILSSYGNFWTLLLRAFSEIGISQVQSFATLQIIPTEFRFGIDHFLSVARRFPDGMLGLDIDWPERIVRISTTAFVDSEAADIPPGLIGQAWLDLPIFGPLLWGFAIGVQVRLLKRWSSKYIDNASKAVVVTLLSFIIALPINTGSFDFTFSVDIIFLVIVISACFRTRRHQAVTLSEASIEPSVTR
jgi:hypothetical protein